MGDYDYSRRTQNFPRPYSTYESVSVTVSGGLTNWSVKDHTSLFSKLETANEILLKNGTKDFSFRYNSVDDDLIKCVTGDFFQVAGLTVRDVLVTTTDDVAFDIFILGYK